LTGPSFGSLFMSSARPIVRLRDVAKTFSNGTLALENLNLDIRDGEFVSLLGPSGCGKSTALRIIAGLGQPTTGSVEWPNAMHDSAGKPEKEIGFVFQEPTLLPWATVFDNVWLPLRLKGVSRKAATERILHELEQVGLTKFAKSYPRELSGGMKMRVSIARAIVTRPKLLLMDEPFAALDEITRQRLNDDILTLKEREGLTVVFVTHSVYESVNLSSRIVVMAARPGRILVELPIEAGYPRGEAFRASSTYSDLCQRASAALMDAIRAAGGTGDEHL
jgi:NitT/TauT family transport system ATP-binding protein